MSRHLLIRADANSKIGTGHVMRCLALAQAWQDDGGTVSLAARELPEGLKERLKFEQVEVVPVPSGSEADDAANLVSLARGKAACVVVDGYAFGIAHQRALREAGIRQLFIDDYGHAPEYVADFVLNQNITADESLYRNRAANTQLLLGTKYAMLRREFRLSVRSPNRTPHSPLRILVSFGGSDPANMTIPALSCLSKLPKGKAEIKALVGVAQEGLEDVRELAREIDRCELINNKADMTSLINWADIAVSAAGSTIWELAFFGVQLFLVVTAENQKATASVLSSNGLATIFDRVDFTTGHALETITQPASSDDYSNCSLRLQELVDAKGALRVFSAISREA